MSFDDAERPTVRPLDSLCNAFRYIHQIYICFWDSVLITVISPPEVERLYGNFEPSWLEPAATLVSTGVGTWVLLVMLVAYVMEPAPVANLSFLPRLRIVITSVPLKREISLWSIFSIVTFTFCRRQLEEASKTSSLGKTSDDLKQNKFFL